jgi:hypothetical protein
VIGASLSLPALSFNTLSHDLLASFQPDSAYLHPSETRTGAVLPQIAPDAGTGIVSAAQRPRPVLWNSCGDVCASLEMVAFGEEGHTRTGAVSGSLQKYGCKVLPCEQNEGARGQALLLRRHP